MRKWYLVVLGLTVFLAPFVYVVTHPADTQASCAAPRPDFSGTWIRQSGNRDISKVSFRFACGDHVLCPIGGQCSQPFTGFYVQLTSYNGQNWGEIKTYEDYYHKNVRTAVYRFRDAQVYLSATIAESGVNKGQLLLEWRIEWWDRNLRPVTGSAYYVR